MNISKYRELVVSFIRSSLVPPAVGLVGAFFVNKWGFHLNTAFLYATISTIFSGIWYVIFRALEILSKNPKVIKWAGIFLGSTTKPVGYEKHS